MGTDIHGIIRTYLPDGGDPTAKRPWCIDEMSERTRNYRAFAVLAGVRNGFGFAGVPTHKPVQPIAPDLRGLPPDLEDHVIDGEDVQTWPHRETVWLGDHSYTHLWLSEILAYDWDQTFDECGVISREAFEAWSGQGSPDTGWSGDISGGGVIKADQYGLRPEGWTHIRCYWQESLREACQPYPAYFEYLAKCHPPEDTLIVLGFDS